MEQNAQPGLENWDDFRGKWFRADFVKTYPAVVVFTTVKGEFDSEGDAHLIYELQFDGKKLKWEPNKTNIEIMKKLEIISPRAIIGKKVTFVKIKVRNPQTKQMVDSLIIDKIE